MANCHGLHAELRPTPISTATTEGRALLEIQTVIGALLSHPETRLARLHQARGLMGKPKTDVLIDYLRDQADAAAFLEGCAQPLALSVGSVAPPIRPKPWQRCHLGHPQLPPFPDAGRCAGALRQALTPSQTPAGVLHRSISIGCRWLPLTFAIPILPRPSPT